MAKTLAELLVERPIARSNTVKRAYLYLAQFACSGQETQEPDSLFEPVPGNYSPHGIVDLHASALSSLTWIAAGALVFRSRLAVEEQRAAKGDGRL